jgi:ATPase subunit of ABC transporter with duplicated ATPase domains
MPENEVILRFDKVNFDFGEEKPILKEANFILRKGSKVTVMGQNGAGKSTILGLITQKYKPKEGQLSVNKNLKIGYAKQVMDRQYLELTIKEYFAKAFEEVPYNLDVHIAEVLEAVDYANCNLTLKVGQLSGGQQARLLLAFALISDPDILLLDEPTNNLDTGGIEHLTGYLMMYDKTCVVISHDADFLNAFTDTVWYLDVYTHTVEMYDGNYYDVVEQIKNRIERENRQNARIKKEILDKKEKINFFAHKGGKMRKLASKLKEEVEEASEQKIEVRREDRTIRDFQIPCQEELGGELLILPKIPIIKNHNLIYINKSFSLRKGDKLQIIGPNGIGKTTFLENLANKKIPEMQTSENLEIGYYRQDFSTLDFDKTVRESLLEISVSKDEEYIRKISAGFLITSKIINLKIGNLSEGQKGLVAFTHLVLQRPGLLILDEPTNHINFRHIPVIAKALDEYEGAMIVVSHVSEFINQINFNQFIDLKKLRDN